MLNLVIGRAGTGKSDLLLGRICAAAEGRHILLVPEPQSHQTERLLCEKAGASVSLRAEVLTFSRLANRIFQTAGGLGRQELDPGGRLLLMWRAVQSVSDHLCIYARPSRNPAFLSGLLSVVDELKSCCIPPEELTLAGEQIGGSDGARLCDLGLICGAYDALTANIALDPRDRLSRAAEKLAKCGWAQGAHFYLDGFVDFTPQQLELIRLLLQQGEEVSVALTCDRLTGQDDTSVFAAARITASRLIRMAQELGCPWQTQLCEQPTPVRSEAMVHLERQLFDADIENPASCGDQVQLFCAGNPRAEVEWTAAKIRTLAQQGMRMRDIAVVARNYDRYDGLIESVFHRYDIPVYRSVKSNILQRPVLTLVCAALDAVSGGYTYDDVFRYLKTDLTDLSRTERDELENYALKWNIHGSRWTQEAPWTMHPKGYGFAVEEADRQQLAQLDALRRRVVEPLEKLRRNRLCTGAGQAQALYGFLEEIGLDRRLEQRCEQLTEQGLLTLAQEYGQLWEILCRGLEQCAQLLGDTPMQTGEFSRLLRLVLSQYEVGTIPVSLDRVTAGELVRHSGHSTKVLFVLGADEGSLPGRGQPAGLLSDDDRELLAGCGVDLGMRGRDRLYREMTDIYTACTLPGQMLVVTWPAHSGEEELQPSFLVERLQRIFSDLRVQTEEDGAFRLCAPGAALECAGYEPTVRKVLEQMPDWCRQVERLARAEDWQRGKLSRQAVDRLYGSRVPMSASRMDKYKACHFSYFMRYGLKAEPRRSAGFDAPEYGTFVHFVLEQVFQNDSWRGSDGQVNSVKLKNLTRVAVERYIKEELGGLEEQSPRFVYLFRRLIDGVDQVVDNVAQELAVSRFVPVDFEVGFGAGADKALPAVEVSEDGVTICVTGAVDRVDRWQEGEHTYLRIVDYKTGKKTFDLTEVAFGMGLQMLLYLFTLCREGEQRYGKNLVPAGVLYLPARDVTVPGSRSMSAEDHRKLVDSQLRRKGLILDEESVLAAMEQPGEKGLRFLPVRLGRDGASGDSLISAHRFVRLEQHVQRVLRDICREIAAGNIAADPFWRGQEHNACRFCDYAAACHFEEGRGGDCRRRLAGVSTEEFWHRVCPGEDIPQEGQEREQ